MRPRITRPRQFNIMRPRKGSYEESVLRSDSVSYGVLLPRIPRPNDVLGQ
jgi:hypothetical protein